MSKRRKDNKLPKKPTAFNFSAGLASNQESTGGTLYADLSKATMENHRQLATITKAIQNHTIHYKWGLSNKLLITHQNKTHAVRTLSVGLKLLRSWHIIPEDDPDPSNQPSAHMETGGA